MNDVYVNLNDGEFLKLNAFGKCNFLFKKTREIIEYRSNKDKTKLYLDGYASCTNKDTDAIESMSRAMVFLSVFLAKDTSLSQSLREELIVLFTSYFVNSSDSKSKSYWGNLHDYDQRLAEMADYALALWVTKEYVWINLEFEQQSKITDYLKQANHVRYSDNNWHLFVMLINEVISSLSNEQYHDSDAAFNKIKSFLNEDGWFKDGESGGYDYYNAWAFYYSLYWLSEINPQRYKHFFKTNFDTFFSSYEKLINNDGFPFFGRSACYKYAITVPNIINALSTIDKNNKIKAIEVFNNIWNVYSVYEINKNKILSQGLYGDQPEWLDNYSGPGSSLWSLRSCIILIYNYDEFLSIDLTKSIDRTELTPKEKTLKECDLKIVSDSNLVEVSFLNKTVREISVEKYSNKHKLIEFICQRANRPQNIKKLESKHKLDSVNVDFRQYE
ncbi:DUF2264 domain-containing protein [Vibrio breoganii]